MNELKKAIIKKTQKVIEVYRHHLGGWVDYADCCTIYEEKELTFK